MTNEMIKEMADLQRTIDEATARLDELKRIARNYAHGQQVCYTAGQDSVTVSKPGKPTTTLDTAKFKVKAPKLYAEVMGKYSKVGSARAAAVKIYYAK